MPLVSRNHLKTVEMVPCLSLVYLGRCWFCQDEPILHCAAGQGSQQEAAAIYP